MKTIDFLLEELPKRGGWPDGAIGAGFLSGEGTLYFWDKNNDCPPKWTIDTDIEVEDSDEEVTREQYEAALAAKNDGWIDWPGGKCPVPKGTLVDVKWRDGRIDDGIPAKISHDLDSSKRNAIRWRHHGYSHDIIAYRLHQPQEAEQAKADDEADLNECIGQDAAPVWNGEGLPPVGCECQYRKHKKSEQSEWFSGVVKYASEFTVVIQAYCYPGETVGHPANFKFRPIRSEAELKRDEAAQALCTAGGGNGNVDEKSGYGSCWFDIYDAIAAGKIPGVKLDD